MDRESLIRGLQEELSEGAKDSASGRYNKDTQTLFAEKDMAKGKKQINFEAAQYNDVVLGKTTFIVTQDQGFKKEEMIAFVEVNGFSPTGRITLKQISSIYRGEHLEQGYCVIGWR